jgi:hypothetical protein
LSCRSSSKADSNTTTVAESLTLFSLKPEFDESQISEVIDSCWSLQYMVRGPVCGSAGPIVTAITQSNQDRMKQFNHCMYFRYASESAMEQFMGHLKTKYLLDEVSRTKTTSGVVSIQYSTAVPNDLESIFRRGAQWEEGYEVLLGLVDAEGSNPEDIDEFLRLTSDLAQSSAYGALQAATGPVTTAEVKHHTLNPSRDEEIQLASEAQEQFECNRIFMARFPSDLSVVESFMNSPPLQAILAGDERSPVSSSWGIVVQLSPSETSSSSM